MSLRHRFSFCLSLFLTLNFGGTTTAQRIVQLSPPNTSIRGVCLADSTHSMAVGDSASILISGTSDPIGHWYWFRLQAPCDKSHTLNGVSYYDTTRAAIVSDAGLIFTTSDAGRHWSQSGAGITGQTLRAITHTTNGSLIVVGDSGIILRSLDSGATWSKIYSSSTHNINAISINARGIGFFAGDHGLLGKTNDFGATWPYVTDTITSWYNSKQPINFRGVAVNDVAGGMAVGDSGGLAQITSGVSWKAYEFTAPYFTNQALLAPTIRNCSFSSVLYCNIQVKQGVYGPAWLVSGDNDFYLQTASGQNVIQTPQFQGDADGGSDFCVVRYTCAGVWRGSLGGTIQICSPFEVIWSSSDGSATAYPGIVEPDYLIPTANFLYLSIDSLGKGFATTTGGDFARTRDNGLSWKYIYEDDNVFKGTDIYTFDSNNALVLGWSGEIYRTKDGMTWNKTLIDPNKERLHSIAHPANDIFVVCGDYGTIFRSTDNAETWNPFTTTTSAFLEGMAFSTPEIGIAAGTNGTILRTTDRGVTWTEVNNVLSGGSTSYRRVEAFRSGTYFATTDSSGLYRSNDQGLTWNAVSSIPKTMGMGFYNEYIGVIAEYAIATTPWDVHYIGDTARLAFTKDGFATAPVEFNVPIIINYRMAFHFLDSNTFLCLGSDGFVVKVDMSKGPAIVTKLSSANAPLVAFPNPSTAHETTVEYDLDHAGATTIELWNERGERVQVLYRGNEEQGSHLHSLAVNPMLHGSFFIKVNAAGVETKTMPIVID